MDDNCTFYTFKPSGKYYTDARGVLSPETFEIFDAEKWRAKVLADNGGAYPGLDGAGDTFIWVVMPDADHPNGYPMMKHPDDYAVAATDPDPEYRDESMLRWFAHSHLRGFPRTISHMFGRLAVAVARRLPRGSERTVALRKLLEAKDAAVRASLEKGGD